MRDLEARLLAAHARRDLRALVTLYSAAADTASSQDAGGFFLTQAYVYALDCNHPAATALHARLVAEGREA